MPMNENDRQNDRKNDRQDRPFERRDRRDRRDREQPESEWKERLVALNRVTKVVKGGKNFRFAALVVVGNEKGQVGAAIGKAKEVPEAIRKAKEAAMKHLVAKVVLLPAEEGAGVIAGGGARAVLELAGVKDIRTKTFGTNNRINTVKATLEGLKGLRNAETVAKMRGKTVEEIVG